MTNAANEKSTRASAEGRARMPTYVGRGAVFGHNRTYRYVLLRRWSDATPEPLIVIGLNPSTADENTDDPTVRRCVRYAERWGFGSLIMLNIFAYRATDPRTMLHYPTPIGPDNNSIIIGTCAVEQRERDAMVLCAWGAHGAHMLRGIGVRRMLEREGVALHHLGLTKAGEPRHPLYLPSTAMPVRWKREL
jgi:hypothetical protein